METSTNNRIPLRVNHGDPPPPPQSTHQTTSSRTFSRSATDNQQSAYDMRNMYDETDRIKSRMREFEERCKRWREDFFNKSSTGAPLFANNNVDFDQRVPFTNANELNTSPSSGQYQSPHFVSPTSTHRNYIEDAADGGKKYKIEFDIGDFRQNEILITTNGRSLILKGDRELKAGTATETKTFNRELTLPDYVDFDKMNAYLLENGAPQTTSSSTSSPLKPNSLQQQQLVTQVNNVLVIEAPIVMDKYSYRRSAFDTSASPTNRHHFNSNLHSPSTSRRANFFNDDLRTNAPSQQHHRNTSKSTTTLLNPNLAGGNIGSNARESSTETHHHHHSESKTSSSTSQSTTQRVVHSSQPHLIDENNIYATSNSRYQPAASPNQDDASKLNSPIKSSFTSPSHLNLNQHATISPELIPGYPIYDNAESCVVYKFDLSGFDQSEIHLTITVDRTLEIKACKELTDHLGKIYREFKREIQLEPEVDANLIKNLLHDGILTLKIPKQNRPDGLGSISNTHNLHDPNGFREIYTDDGKLSKITTDFRGFNPENLKIVLSANNVLKITAQQSETSSTQASKGSVQKECTRQYALPGWIQPENMKAVMSRDGLLTIDFSTNNSKSGYDDRGINIF